MAEKIIVMPGSSHLDSGTLYSVARGFGWTVEVADDLQAFAKAQGRGRTTAVLFHREALGTCSWPHAVRLVKAALPKAHAIACHGFSEPIDWPELCAAGAFHSLRLPLKENEVRQSLGFVWGARRRLGEAPEEARAFVPARKPYANQRITPAMEQGVQTRFMASVAG
jgi:hypothetical protein